VRFNSIPLLAEDLFEALRDDSVEPDIPSQVRGAV
jgi:hypothetical protein